MLPYISETQDNNKGKGVGGVRYSDMYIHH